jgi:hypothetical protein
MWKAECLLPYLQQSSSCPYPQPKNSPHNIQPCFFKTLLRCSPSESSHRKWSSSSQQFKYCERRVHRIWRITYCRMLLHVIMIALELFQMMKLLTRRRLSSNLTVANSMARKFYNSRSQLRAATTNLTTRNMCLYSWKQPWKPVLVIRNLSGPYSNVCQRVKRCSSSLLIFYIAQMKEAKHYLDYVHWQSELLS